MSKIEVIECKDGNGERFYAIRDTADGDRNRVDMFYTGSGRWEDVVDGIYRIASLTLADKQCSELTAKRAVAENAERAKFVTVVGRPVRPAAD